MSRVGASLAFLRIGNENQSQSLRTTRRFEGVRETRHHIRRIARATATHVCIRKSEQGAGLVQFRIAVYPACTCSQRCPCPRRLRFESVSGCLGFKPRALDISAGLLACAVWSASAQSVVLLPFPQSIGGTRREFVNVLKNVRKNVRKNVLNY